jgi:hypothetical protein
MKLFTILCCIGTLFFISNLTQLHSSFSDSPSLNRHEIRDDVGDWFTRNTTEGEFTHDASKIEPSLQKALNTEKTGDIVAVTLVSNGEILNVTYWLSSPFNNNPVKNSPEYYIRIDIDANPLTGDKHGADYLFDILWNNDTKKWQSVLQEYSITGNVRPIEFNAIYAGFHYSQYDSEIIAGRVNKTDYLNCCYISFPIDLKLLNYPDQYSISFYIRNNISSGSSNVPIQLEEKLNNYTIYSFNGKFMELLDSSKWVEIPLPQFPLANESENIKLSNSDLEVPITVQSTSMYPTLVTLSLGNSKEFPSNHMSISPKVREVEPHGKTIFYLRYTGKINESNSYLVSVNPIVYYKNIAQYETRQLTDLLNVNLIAEDPIDMISTGWNKLGGPIAFFYGVLAGISPWLYKKIMKSIRKRSS